MIIKNSICAKGALRYKHQRDKNIRGGWSADAYTIITENN